ncbi:MAG: glycoside hydrolase [Deltaproteobacteria bacterium]|nr:glycoside hydrolase [Deltaproteobacteria bacterium]
MENKLNIAFVWHMHQPLYKDPITEEYTMPWVLFHGTKDYYDMVAILEEFPQVHQTFNIVPCLIEQLTEYGSGQVNDRYRNITRKPASELTREDKSFILQYFFQANWEHMIKPLPRYQELLRKRGYAITGEDIPSVLRYFKEQDYLDLQVLFNLVWIDPVIRAKDEFLSALYTRGGGFTEDDKERLLEKQVEIIRMILPKYRELQEKGIIEVSTTPYYHPIMPLLCDSFSAKEAMPHAALPKERFVHPEDAREQLRRGVALYKETFGHAPRGIWPSEGSVSMDILPILAGEGVKWFATDEEILSNTLRRPIRRDSSGNCCDAFLYRPYSIDSDGKSLSAVFRDHVLSDLIGFDYAKMDPAHAADDMVGRLAHIHGMLENPEAHIVNIILDGENAWEHFRNDGRDFLVALYSRLTDHPLLRPVTVNEFLSKKRERDTLNWIYPGSWISHNFKIWIGHAEDNAAWDYIAGARAALVEYEESAKNSRDYKARKKSIDAAWETLYAAEGSDWFWWYGDDHSSMLDEHFDYLFRRNIKKIYTLMETEPPDSLDIPISTEIKGYRPRILPQAYINPVIDGAVTSYFEWLSAGYLERQFFGTAMHRDLQGEGLIGTIAYGFSQDALFFRLDYLEELIPHDTEWSFTVNFLDPMPLRVQATVKGRDAKAVVFGRVKDKWVETDFRADIAADTAVELGIDLLTVGAVKGGELKLFISIDGADRGIERWPVKGFLIFDVPSEDFEQQNWIV